MSHIIVTICVYTGCPKSHDSFLKLHIFKNSILKVKLTICLERTKSHYHHSSSEYLAHSQIYWWGHVPPCSTFSYTFSHWLLYGLLSSLPKSCTLRLQRLQNWAARLVFTVNRQQDPKPMLKSLHWLPVKQRISFKLLLYVLKSRNCLAPVYLSNCFKLHVPTRNLA